MSLTHRIFEGEGNPLLKFENYGDHSSNYLELERIHSEFTNSLRKHRYKEALRSIMSASQLGNQVLQSSTPWKFLKSDDSEEKSDSLSSLLLSLSITFIESLSEIFKFSGMR